MKKISRRNFLRAAGATAAVTALGGMLSACGSSSSAGSAAGSAAGSTAAAETTVTVAQISEVANLNPLIEPRTPDSNVQCMIFDYLVTPDKDLNYIGDLASSWDISDDGLTYTFHLVENAVWHDGQPFTADDVIYTLTAMASPTYTGGASSRVLGIEGASDYQAGTATSVSGLSAPDTKTVVVKLASPNAAFLGNMYTAILPKHVLESVDPADWATADFNRSPIGTGKYKFVSWQAGQYIELQKNPDYWGTAPSIDHVFVRFGDETTLTAALCNNEIDVLYGLSTADVDTINAVQNVDVYQYEQLSLYYIGLNLLCESLSDLKVRQALSYALDKKTMVATVFGDYGYAADDIFPDGHWSHSTTVATYPYDVAKAKSLLEEAGYTMNASTGYYEKNGQTLHLTYDLVTSTDGDNFAALVQQYWKAAGVELEIIDQDFSTLAFTKLFPQNSDGTQREVTADDFMCYTLGFGVEADPDEYRDYFTTSKGAGSWNFIHYSNAQVDELFQKQLTLTDSDERAKCFHEIADLVSKDIPWIPLYGKFGLAGVNKSVSGFVCDFRGITFQIEKWSMT